MTTEREKQRGVYQCDKCEKDAVGCFRPDMDMRGLCFCAKHKEEVMLEYMKIISGVTQHNI